jgi:hypothetical protein
MPIRKHTQNCYNVIVSASRYGTCFTAVRHIIAPLESAIAGQQSCDKIKWSDALSQQFKFAQSSLANNKSITLRKQSDKRWIVTDCSVTKRGIGATLYVSRHQTLLLAEFFSTKLRKHQVNWLPCEIEALSIAAAVKNFSPFIIQSHHPACILTDSKPCVQAIDKLRRGEFSASPRVTSFLSIVSRYQADIQHLAGSANVPRISPVETHQSAMNRNAKFVTSFQPQKIP